MSPGSRAVRWRAGPASSLVLLLTAILLGCGTFGHGGLQHQSDQALLRGDVELALEGYRAILDERPGDPGALLGLARAYLAAGNPEAALGILAGLEVASARGATSMRPTLIAALDYGAQARISRNDPAGALLLLERLEEYDPELPDLSGRIVDASLQNASRLAASGRWHELESETRRLLERTPGHPEAALALAEALIGQARGDEAASVLESVVSADEAESRWKTLMDRASQIRYPTVPAKPSP